MLIFTVNCWCSLRYSLPSTSLCNEGELKSTTAVFTHKSQVFKTHNCPIRK